MKRLAIIGAGHLGQIIAYHAIATKQYSQVVFFDDYCKPGSSIGKGQVVLGAVKDAIPFYENGDFDFFMIGIGYNHMTIREHLYTELVKIIPAATFIHPHAYIDPSCTIGRGVFIHPGCTLDRGAVIKDNVLLNTSCTIAHDSIINAHSFLAPRVAIAGFSTIGEKCNLGINTTIIDNIKVTNNTRTGAGCVIVKDIIIAGLYVGVPAKLINSLSE